MFYVGKFGNLPQIIVGKGLLDEKFCGRCVSFVYCHLSIFTV